MMQVKDFAVQAALEAGKLLVQRFGSIHEVSFKGEIDLVTEADRQSERFLIDRIRSAFPDHDILSEESPPLSTGADYRWIIDPLDGTTNYAHGFPFFCVSIALERKGVVVLGVIFDPLRDELFTAERGMGAFLNTQPLRVSQRTRLSDSLLATGFPYDIRVNPDNNLNHFGNMALRARAIRRAGSAALDLAFLAAGRFDGFWELRLHPWDTAAGTLLVTEAGGLVTDLDGSTYHLESPAVVASNSFIHQDMLTVIAGGISGNSGDRETR